MQKRKDRLPEVLNTKVTIRKTRSILAMFSIYFFCILLYTIFWAASYPKNAVLFIGSNLTRLVPGFLVCFFLFNIQMKLLDKYSNRLFLLMLFIIITTMSLSIADGYLYLVNFNLWVNAPVWKISIPATIQASIDSFVTFISTASLFYIIYYRSVINKQEQQIAEVQALANEAQLLMLRYQINPHFLFNSLNAIQAMIEKDKSRAKEMIGDMADFFRYTLSKNNQMLVTISEEIEAVNKYLAIQKDRFGDRLETSLQIDPNVLGIRIPFFLIHPLVENALKYGLASKPEVLQLKIKIELKDEKLSILVSNSGKLDQVEISEINEKQSTKTGIENIRKRLAIFYPSNHEFNLYEKDGFVHAQISINLT